jgi:DNA processing protein
MTETDALLVLNAVEGLGNHKVHQLLENFGSARGALAAAPDEWRGRSGLTGRQSALLAGFRKEEFLEKELRLMDRLKVRVCSFRDEAFPVNLRPVPDTPVILYYKGKTADADRAAVAVVGSRNASADGCLMAGRFAARLGELGITIVSGLARGIDAAAHRGCLEAGGRTIAVLGSGLGRVYPPEHGALLEQIAGQGVVFSEFPLQAEPVPFHFPRRNRVISGLSLGVIVAEAAKKSGALITSRFALEQGREVFAVPGRIDQPTALGAHHLIKQGAKLIESVEDVLEELQVPLRDFLKSGPSGPPERKMPELPEDAREIYRQLGTDPLPVDVLSARCPLPPGRLMDALLQLEIRRLARRWPGQLYSKS